MKYLSIFSDINTLLSISHAIGESLNEVYQNDEDIFRLGYLPIHEAYYNTIMQVLREFEGRYELNRAVFSEPDENGNVEISWEKLSDFVH